MDPSDYNNFNFFYINKKLNYKVLYRSNSYTNYSILMDRTNIYILKLTNNKFYVGKSKNPLKRYNEHITNGGSLWTTLYKPLSIHKIISNVSPYDEDKYVKIYMAHYGIDAVRGGSYVTKNLSVHQKKFIINEIRGATNCCLQCGSKGHFIKQCPTKKIEPINYCILCYREGHNKEHCFATSDIYGNILKNNINSLNNLLKNKIESFDNTMNNKLPNHDLLEHNEDSDDIILYKDPISTDYDLLKHKHNIALFDYIMNN